MAKGAPLSTRLLSLTSSNQPLVMRKYGAHSDRNDSSAATILASARCEIWRRCCEGVSVGEQVVQLVSDEGA